MASEAMTSTGNINVAAAMRVTTKYLNGFMPDTSIASICSVTFIDANSAPMPEPTLPAKIKAVITGPISLTIETATIAGNHDSAPNSASVGLDCIVSTNPIINPVMATNGNDL